MNIMEVEEAPWMSTSDLYKVKLEAQITRLSKHNHATTAWLPVYSVEIKLEDSI